MRRRDDLDPVAVAQHGAKRNEFVVDARGDAAIADVGVHGIGEVDAGGALRHRQDLALGREDVHGIGEEVDLQMLEELDGRAALRLHLQQALQPLVGLLLKIGQLGVARLVEPVGRDAGLGELVHLLRADLHFDRHAERAEQRRVQRLVAVGLRDGDVVLELARDRLVQAVQGAHRPVARGHVLHDHAEAEDVGHLREGEVLLLHLVVDAVEVLLAAAHRGSDAGLLQAGSDRFEDAVDDFATVATRGIDGLLQHLVARREEMPERELLQLLKETVQPEAIGDGRVDVDRLAGDACALLRLHHVERAHVVQPVGELDEDHADIACHREQHLAEVLRLLVFLAFEFDAVELGDAVDEIGHHLAELLGDLGLGDRRVFHHVVEQRGGERLRVEMPLREDLRDRERMGDVGFAGLAELPVVGLGTEAVGGFELREVLRLQVAGSLAQQNVRFRHVAHGVCPVRQRSRSRTGSVDRSLLGSFQDVRVDQPVGDFAQRDDGGFVLVGFHQRRGAVGDFAGAEGGREGEFETIGDAVQGVVDGDACHGFPHFMRLMSSRWRSSWEASRRRSARTTAIRSPAASSKSLLSIT